MGFYITKSSGKKELFNIKKFRRSLQKAGASGSLIGKIVREIEKKEGLRSTKDIYEFALNYLDKVDRPLAARYNLKRALMDLGPAGYSFELFIAELFRHQEYKIEMNKTVRGICVNHEVDIFAHKKDKHYIIECKFHNRRGLKSDVKVPLYIKARFDDVKQAWKRAPKNTHQIHGAWVVTNTVFTSVALQYGNCVGLHMLDWKHPENNSLPDLINRFGLHPITALTSLNKHQKKECIKTGFVLCRQTSEHRDVLKKLRLTDHQIERLIQESEKVCLMTGKK